MQTYVYVQCRHFAVETLTAAKDDAIITLLTFPVKKNYPEAALTHEYFFGHSDKKMPLVS